MNKAKVENATATTMAMPTLSSFNKLKDMGGKGVLFYSAATIYSVGHLPVRTEDQTGRCHVCYRSGVGFLVGFGGSFTIGQVAGLVFDLIFGSGGKEEQLPPITQKGMSST